MRLTPNGRIDLNHRASWFNGLWRSNDGGLIVPYFEDGLVSFVDLTKNSATVRRLSSKVRGMSPHPAESLLAFVDGETGLLVVQTFDGRKIAELKGPPVQKKGGDYLTQGISDCFFDQSGNSLWMVARLSMEMIEVSLIETSTWKVTQRAKIVDDFSPRLGSSQLQLRETGRRGLICLLNDCGPEGQYYWIKSHEDGFSCELIPEPSPSQYCSSPVFSPDGSEFLILTEGLGIYRIGYPSMRRIGRPLESGIDDGPFGGAFCYLDDLHVLAHTEDQRTFLVDVKKSKVQEEVFIEQPETPPDPQANDDGETDMEISWFKRLGDIIVFVFLREEFEEFDWKTMSCGRDSLLWYSVKG